MDVENARIRMKVSEEMRNMKIRGEFWEWEIFCLAIIIRAAIKKDKETSIFLIWSVNISKGLYESNKRDENVRENVVRVHIEMNEAVQ